MSEEKIALDALTSAVKEKGVKWEPAITSISELSSDDQAIMLGLKPTNTELQLAVKLGLDKPVAGSKPPEKKPKDSSNPGSAGLPSKFDWRNVSGVNWTTPIKNQSSCGSCVSFGTLASLEALLKIRTFKDSSKVIDLSEAHLLFCGGGSCSGWHMNNACDYLQKNGVPDEACFPYRPTNMPCSDTCSDWQNRIDSTKITSWNNTKIVEEMKKNIVNNGPQITGMAVYQDFFSYSSGIYEYVTGSLRGYHCVCVVGYDDANECWICKNSWGTGWGEADGGERGWFRIKYGQCGIENVFGMWNMVVPEGPPSRCLTYRSRASLYLALYRRTQNRRYLCLYYRYMAAYYYCMYQETKNRRYLCLYYRYMATYYYCAYQVTRNRKYLCLYYRYMAAYYYCMYQVTRNPNYLTLYRRYIAAYRRCAS
jgi:C1A family cysteine protease